MVVRVSYSLRPGEIMDLAKPCPVCGDTKMTVVLRKGLVKTSDPLDVATVLAYRCQNGHISLPARVANQEDSTEPAA